MKFEDIFFSCLWLLWISHWNIFTMFYFTVLWNSTMYNSEFASSAMLVSKVFICVFSHMGQISGFYLFVSFWDIQVQTFPQISVCETKAWKWVDRLVFNIYIVKSFTAVIIYVQTLDQKIFMLSRRACWFEMQYYPHQTFPCWITITVKHSFLYYFSTM